MGKIVETRKLYKDIIKDVTTSAEKWLSFLNSSAWNFKYDFDDQILIYAQRPDARACASIDEWNTKLKRWIKKGSNGIFVQSKDENSEFPFRIVFDISDTYNAKGTEYKLWQIKSEYEQEIIYTLESNFGEIYNKEDENKSLAQAIYFTALNMVEDNLQNYMEMIINNTKGTKLERMDKASIENIAKVLVISSVTYMMMTRCGIKAKKHIQLEDISLIEYFDGYQIISTIGNAISDIAKQGLKEIAKTVFELQKNEKNIDYTFEKNKNEVYANNELKVKGGIENDRDNIYKGGRLQYTKYDNGTGKTTNREICKNETSISKEVQQTVIYNISNGQKIGRTLDGDTKHSEREGGTNSEKNVKTGENKRRIESTRPNEVGATYEQLENYGRRNSNKGNNLQLEVYEQEKNSSSYVVVDEKINQILATTTFFAKNNSEIIEYFEKEKDISKRAEYLRDIFNSDYTEVIIDNQKFGYKKFENGVLFEENEFISPISNNKEKAESFLTWTDLTYHYEAMILLHQLTDRYNKPKSEQEQQSLIAENNDEVHDLEFTQEFIDKFLQEMHQDLKFSIYKHFEESLSSKENINFLKSVYGEGGQSSVLRGSGIGVWYNAKGMKFNRGYFGESAREKLFNWNYIKKRIRELISLDRYLNPREMEEYPKWITEREQEIDKLNISLSINEKENQILDTSIERGTQNKEKNKYKNIEVR